MAMKQKQKPKTDGQMVPMRSTSPVTDAYDKGMKSPLTEKERDPYGDGEIPVRKAYQKSLKG